MLIITLFIVWCNHFNLTVEVITGFSILGSNVDCDYDGLICMEYNNEYQIIINLVYNLEKN